MNPGMHLDAERCFKQEYRRVSSYLVEPPTDHYPGGLNGSSRSVQAFVFKVCLEKSICA